MSETTARVLRLLGLLQSRPVWTGPELAEHLGVTVRSVRRDVERLRDLGYPVLARKGLGGGYQLGAGMSLPPLLLDPDEAVAVAVCLRLAAGGTVAGVGEAARRTLTKLDQVLPARLRASVEAVSEATVTLGHRDQLVEGAVVALLARAARGCREVRFGYAAASGEQSSRRAEPYRLVATTSRWYLLAWDLDRADWRSFRLDRMSEVRETTFAFAPREAPDAAEHIRESLSRGPQGVEVVLDIDAPLEVVADAVPAGFASLTAAGERCEMRFSAWDVRAAAARLAWLPWSFHVVAPDALGAEVGALAARLAASVPSPRDDKWNATG